MQTYLNDHLSGATAGLDLAKHLVTQNSNSERGQALLQIADQIAEERETLRKVIGALEFKEDPIKKALGWVAEKATLLKLEPMPRKENVARLLGLEALSVGIYGKRSLWQTLEILQKTEPRLSGFEFGALRTQADQQLARLEVFRIRAAA